MFLRKGSYNQGLRKGSNLQNYLKKKKSLARKTGLNTEGKEKEKETKTKPAIICSQETDRCLSTSSLRRVSKITNEKEKSMGLPRGECLECVKGGFPKRAHWVFLHLESEKYKTSHK